MRALLHRFDSSVGLNCSYVLVGFATFLPRGRLIIPYRGRSLPYQVPNADHRLTLEKSERFPEPGVVTSGATDMDIFVRLFVWILNYTYGKRVSPTVYPEIPGQDKVLQEYQDELESQRKDQLVRNFQSGAQPVQGAVDYNELQWTLYTRIAETKTEFLFYRERSVTKVIDKSMITNRLEIAALRRLIRRNVADNVLLDD